MKRSPVRFRQSAPVHSFAQHHEALKTRTAIGAAGFFSSARIILIA
jgi:hypothetical protein